MRKIDKHKTAFEKAAKTINFEKTVLEKLEERCKREGIKESPFVNHIVKEAIMGDKEYYETMRKHYALKVNEYDYMLDRLKAKKEVK